MDGEVKIVWPLSRGRGWTPTISTMEFYVMIVKTWKTLTVFRKNLIFNVTGALVPHSASALSPLVRFYDN